MKRRIVLIEDHTSVRQAVATVLAGDGYEIVGEAATGLEALRLCARTSPDLVLMDLMLPELTGLEVLRHWQQKRCLHRILIYSGTRCGRLISEALQCRPFGFVAKADSIATLREAIAAVLAGRHYFSSFVSDYLFSPAAGAPALELSLRETQVLQLVAEGRSTKEISVQLLVAPKTVEHHRAHLLAKLRLRGTADLTRYAIGRGLVPLEKN